MSKNDIIKEMLADGPLSILITGKPGIGKSFHFPSVGPLHFVDVSLSSFDGYKTTPPHLPGGFFDAPDRSYFYIYDDIDDYRKLSLEAIDPDKGLPEWQKRRNASARAKQALIDKMKAHHAR